jgi:hypothetical protein
MAAVDRAKARHALEPGYYVKSIRNPSAPVSTVTPDFPSVITTRNELAQPPDVGVVDGLRLKLGEDSLQGHT